MGSKIIILFLSFVFSGLSWSVQGQGQPSLVTYRVWKQKKIDEARAIQLDVQREFRKQKLALERQFAEWLESMRGLPQVQEVRFRGLLAAIELAAPAPTWSELIARRVYGFSKNNMLVLAPPLVADPAHLDRAMNEVMEAVRRLPTPPRRAGHSMAPNPSSRP